MKKKNEEPKLSDKIFNILLVIAIIGLLIIIATSPMANFSMSDNKLRQNDSMKSNSEKPVPSQLKWHDSFKGISNEGKKEEGSMNYMK